MYYVICILTVRARAERNLSRGGSEFFFINLGEDRNHFFLILLLFSIKIPKFRGGLILRSSPVPPSLTQHVINQYANNNAVGDCMFKFHKFCLKKCSIKVTNICRYTRFNK